MYEDTKVIRMSKYVVFSITFIASIIMIAVGFKFKDQLDWLIGAGQTLLITWLAWALVAVLDYLVGKHDDERVKQFTVDTLLKNMGIAEFTNDWREHVEGRTEAGKTFHQKLKLYQGEDATWYIITINPHGLTELSFHTKVIIPAIEAGTTIKWSYVKFPKLDSPDTLHKWWLSQYRRLELDKQDTILKHIEINLNIGVQNVFSEVNRAFNYDKNKLDLFEFYESDIPTTYLGITVEKKGETPLTLIDPYLMYPREAKTWGLLLTGRGDVFREYTNSIKDFFELGEQFNYIHRVKADDFDMN